MNHHQTKHHVASQTPSETAVDHKNDEMSNTTESSEEKEQMNDSQSVLVDESILMNKSIGKTLDASLPSIKRNCHDQTAYALLSCNECELPIIERDDRRHHLKKEHDKQPSARNSEDSAGINGAPIGPVTEANNRPEH